MNLPCRIAFPLRSSSQRVPSSPAQWPLIRRGRWEGGASAHDQREEGVDEGMEGFQTPRTTAGSGAGGRASHCPRE
eukprot:2605040-Pyramimonas_sp.AAC.1